MMTTITTTMTAIVRDAYGDSSVLRLERVPRPVAGKGEVVVRVHAAALNPADKFLMLGDPRLIRLMYGLTRPKHRTVGHDFAGVVEHVGLGVTHLVPGDEVFGELYGALAEYVGGTARAVAKMPPAMTYEQAAAIPMAGLAALHGLDASKVTAGTRILINGASGGIGTFAVQIAKARGAEVTAVCSTRNVDLVRSLGADHVVDYVKQRVLDPAREYDVILDNIGNVRIRDWRTMLTPRGILLPNTGESGADGGVLKRMLTSAWASATSRQTVKMFTSTASEAGLTVLATMAQARELVPVIDTMFTLDHAADAMERLATRHVRGKVVVSVP